MEETVSETFIVFDDVVDKALVEYSTEDVEVVYLSSVDVDADTKGVSDDTRSVIVANGSVVRFAVFVSLDAKGFAVLIRPNNEEVESVSEVDV